MTPLPPRTVTFEHEAAHALVARRGGGSVDYIHIGISPLSSSKVSLGHTQWRPTEGDTNTLIAGYVAGPAQTALSVERGGLSAELYEQAIDAEATDMAAMLNARGGNASKTSTEGLIRKHMDSMKCYLKEPEVHKAVQSIKDVLMAAESDETTRVTWDELEPLVDWDRLPPLPDLV